MHKPIEMIFIDELDEFMRLIEALNAGDQTCPVYLAFDASDFPHWMIATTAIRARFAWQGKAITTPTRDVIKQMEKITFVIQPTEMSWLPHNSSFSSVDPIPF